MYIYIYIYGERERECEKIFIYIYIYIYALFLTLYPSELRSFKVNEIELLLRYFFHFRANGVGKGRNPLTSSASGLKVSLLFLF